MLGSSYTTRDIGDKEVAFYEYHFKLGVRLLLHPFFYQFLIFYGICSTQLTPNGWVVMLGVVVLAYLSKSIK